MRIFGLITVFWLSLSAVSCGQQKATPAEFSPVEDIELYNFDQLSHLFSKKTDSIYVINFWATWCGPCVKELPYFEELNKQYKDKKVKIILVSLDFKKQVKTKLIPFLNKRKLQSEVVVLYHPNANEWIDRVDPSWSGAIPATLVYKRENREFYEQSFENYEELESIIKNFLNI